MMTDEYKQMVAKSGDQYDPCEACQESDYHKGIGNGQCHWCSYHLAASERDHLKARLRETAQILIAEVGACGPCNAEDAAQTAVDRIQALKARVEELEARWPCPICGLPVSDETTPRKTSCSSHHGRCGICGKWRIPDCHCLTSKLDATLEGKK